MFETLRYKALAWTAKGVCAQELKRCFSDVDYHLKNALRSQRSSWREKMLEPKLRIEGRRSLASLAKGMETKAELREERNHVGKSLGPEEEEKEEDSLQCWPGV